MTEESCKITFELQQDADGYPPVTSEILWANWTESGLYEIDNIPFYVKGISSGDKVWAETNDGQLEFRKLVEPSPNSVIRLYVFDVADVPATRDQFEKLGCESELSDIPKLIAVEVPGNVDFETIAKVLDAGVASERWEYEEGVLRHKISA